MRHLIQVKDIDNLIEIHKGAIRLYVAFAIGIFSFGIALLVLGNTIKQNDVVKTIIKEMRERGQERGQALDLWISPMSLRLMWGD